MTASIFNANKYLFVILIVTVIFLSACNTDFFKKSAQELTGGNGAGLSEYQVTPVP